MGDIGGDAGSFGDVSLWELSKAISSALTSTPSFRQKRHITEERFGDDQS